MKNLAKFLVAALLVVVQQVSGQQINISQHDLPYEIPVIESPSSGEGIQYRWLENDQEIEGADSPSYTIPAGKPSGTYTYIHQVKCAGCTGWLSSNSFTAKITRVVSNASARVLNANLSVTFSPQQELEGYLDHLISVIDESQQSLEISLYSFEDYDVYQAFGNLHSVTWASQTQEYLYDANDRQIATIQNGAVRQKLIFGLGSVPLAQLNENDRIINTFIYADSQTPVLMRKGNTDYYLISDIRGSVRMVVKVSTGDIRQQMEYDAFGKVISDSNPGYTPFGYAGGLYDYRTDLIRFGARDYYPETGRWTAEDPIGFWSGDVNFYAYVGNDPINFVDPSGLSKGANNAIGNKPLTHSELQSVVRSGAARGSTTAFRSFTKSNFRTNLGRLTGKVPANSQAHHVFPQKFGAEFSKRGINIHDPKFGTWWNTSNHLQNARGYNAAWNSFLKTNPNQSQILNYGRQLMGQYGIPVGF